MIQLYIYIHYFLYSFPLWFVDAVVCFLFFFKDLLVYWLIDWLLCWVFVSVLGLSLVAASGGHSSSQCVGLSLSWPLLLRSTGSRHAGSVVVAHGPSCSAACRNLPRPGRKPVSPALAGRFSTAAPPGKPFVCFLMKIFKNMQFHQSTSYFCSLAFIAPLTLQ